MMTSATSLVYLLAAVLFILGLRFLSSPRTAREGNGIAALGMTIALAWTLVLLWPTFTTAGIETAILGVVVGAGVGTVAARRVKLTAMPQMVAAFNGAGGGAAALVALVELLRLNGVRPDLATGFPSLFALVIGGVSLTGSALAFAKLQELMPGQPVTYPRQRLINGGVGAGIVILTLIVLVISAPPAILLSLLLLSLAFGAAFVLPIGGADMPVVIALLNACTGLAVAASGFVLDNFALIVAGTLVGSSGTILTRLMARAMGRSLPNILFGAFGQLQTSTGDQDLETRTVRSTNVEDVATMLAYSHSVIIVPGYGLAVAQGQHAVRELAAELQRRGVEVSYAIHPVAGRMPGHMNVLLAEAGVSYEQLREMDAINSEFPHTDVALVVGANDVVNPAARDVPESPIYGMPILDVDKARSVGFLKRSLRPGFAGIDNQLLYDPKTMLLFGDARDSLAKLVAAVKTA
jgi:H+-translocating NAD(P) transhydrogenase subunit beta